MELVRCFVAVELPDDIRNGLHQIQDGIRRAGKNFVRWVSPESVHLTLKFLGWVPAETVPRVVKGIEDAVAGISPFHLETDGLGLFPKPQSPRVVWVGLRGDIRRLLALQESVEAKLGASGFEKEDRAFTPHLTLGRLDREATPEERRRFGEIVLGYQASARNWEVNSVSLMRSTLLPRGAVYTRISSLPFGAGAVPTGT